MNNSTSDILYRIAGLVMVLSGLWNMLMSAIWFLSLIWVCVGVFWLLPGLLAFGGFLSGILLLVTGGQNKMAGFAPLLMPLASLMNFNFVGLMLDLVALLLGIVGFTQYVDPEQG